MKKSLDLEEDIYLKARKVSGDGERYRTHSRLRGISVTLSLGVRDCKPNSLSICVILLQ